MSKHNNQIKVALLGSFPMYPYKDIVAFRNPRKGLVTSWNYNLAKALAKISNLEVHFFANASLWKTKVVNDEGLNIHFVGHPPRLDILNRLTQIKFSQYQLHRMLNKLKPDIVHGIGTDHEYAYIAVTSRFPHVITLHGIMKQIVMKMNPPWFSTHRLFAKYEKRAINNAKDLIAINPYVLEQIEQDYSGNVYHIANAIHPDFFRIPGCEEYDIAFVGIYDKRKRLLNLIKACNRVKETAPNLQLKIIGSNRDSSYENLIKKYIEENNLKNNIEFVGQLSQKELAKKLAKTKLLVLPSIEETAPMVIAEAQALGKPVIATDVGGIKHMIRDGVTGFVISPDDINAIAEKVRLLLEDDTLRRDMGKRVKQKAGNTYHPDIIAEKTFQVYKEIFSRKES